MRRHRDARLNVINAYQGLLVRAYCLGRFSKVAMAQAAARRLGLENVRYRIGNVMDFRGGQLYDAGIHAGHRASQSRARGAALLEQIAVCL